MGWEEKLLPNPKEDGVKIPHKDLYCFGVQNFGFVAQGRSSPNWLLRHPNPGCKMLQLHKYGHLVNCTAHNINIDIIARPISYVHYYLIMVLAHNYFTRV